MKLNAKKLILIGLIILGAYWCIEALRIGLWVRKGPGPGFLPLLAGGLCILLSLVVLFKDLKNPESEKFDIKALLPVGALVATLLVSYLVGVTISLVIFVFLWLFLFEKLPLRNSLAVAIIWPGVLYAIFVLWLQTPLPQGLLGWL